MTSNDRRDSDLIETLVSLASMLGFSGMRVRWKLLHWQKGLQDWRQRTRGGLRHAGYRHAVCPQCGQVQDRYERRCVHCSAVLAPRPWQVVRRLGLVMPTALSVSTLLGMVIAVAYLRLMIARPGSGYFSVASDDLIYLGAYYLPALRAGQLWRHATAVFLHIGLIHLAFNMVALAQIGPAIEDVFGGRQRGHGVGATTQRIEGLGGPLGLQHREPERRRGRRDHLVHQHLEPERHARGGPAGPKRE